MTPHPPAPFSNTALLTGQRGKITKLISSHLQIMHLDKAISLKKNLYEMNLACRALFQVIGCHCSVGWVASSMLKDFTTPGHRNHRSVTEVWSVVKCSAAVCRHRALSQHLCHNRDGNKSAEKRGKRSGKWSDDDERC